MTHSAPRTGGGQVLTQNDADQAPHWRGNWFHRLPSLYCRPVAGHHSSDPDAGRIGTLRNHCAKTHTGCASDACPLIGTYFCSPRCHTKFAYETGLSALMRWDRRSVDGGHTLFTVPARTTPACPKPRPGIWSIFAKVYPESWRLREKVVVTLNSMTTAISPSNRGRAAGPTTANSYFEQGDARPRACA